MAAVTRIETKPGMEIGKIGKRTRRERWTRLGFWVSVTAKTAQSKSQHSARENRLRQTIKNSAKKPFDRAQKMRSNFFL